MYAKISTRRGDGEVIVNGGVFLVAILSRYQDEEGGVLSWMKVFLYTTVITPLPLIA